MGTKEYWESRDRGTKEQWESRDRGTKQWESRDRGTKEHWESRDMGTKECWESRDRGTKEQWESRDRGTKNSGNQEIGAQKNTGNQEELYLPYLQVVFPLPFIVLYGVFTKLSKTQEKFVRRNFFAFLNAYYPKTHLIKAQNSLDSSRPYGRL